MVKILHIKKKEIEKKKSHYIKLTAAIYQKNDLY